MKTESRMFRSPYEVSIKILKTHFYLRNDLIQIYLRHCVFSWVFDEKLFC